MLKSFALSDLGVQDPYRMLNRIVEIRTIF